MAHYRCAIRRLYANALGHAWLISGAARVMQPGCEVEGTLVLEGAQKVGTNTAMTALTPVVGWMGKLGSDLAAFQTLMKLRGKWLVEMSGMSHARMNESDELKGFLTETADHYKAPYAHMDQVHPRQCIFFGSSVAGAAPMPSPFSLGMFFTISPVLKFIRMPFGSPLMRLMIASAY